MPFELETERLILRPLLVTDANDLFELDSDLEVHRYLKASVTSIDEVFNAISYIQAQYKEFGTGRLAVVLKDSSECIGWCGLKYMENYTDNAYYIYDLGYRFKQKHWGKGYASESAKVVLEHGFKHFNLNKIYAITDPENNDSKHVLYKLGFSLTGKAVFHDELVDCFELERDLFLTR